MKPEFLMVPNNSPEWLAMRVGVQTASCAHYHMPHKKTGKPKESRQTYMNKLIAEICTGRGEELNAKALEWGKVNESAARAAYEFEAGESIREGGFVYALDKRVGCSPDGLVNGKTKGLELKCPFSSETHVDFLLDDFIKDEYLAQCQWSMWVTGFDEWAFASFDPRMKKHMIKTQLIERDPKLMTYFDEEIPAFIQEMDKHLKKLSVNFGDQWK